MGGGEGTDSTRRIPQLVKGVDRCDFKRPPHNIIIFYKVSIKDEIGVGWVTYDERGPGTRGGGVVIH